MASNAPYPSPASATRRVPLRLAALVVVLGSLLMPPADARVQSDASLRQSEASLMASVEVPVAVVGALAAGGAFVVTAVAMTAVGVAVTVSAVGLGASFVVHLAVDAAKGLAIFAGMAVEAVAVSGGWLLMAAGEALCFVADKTARDHVHSREYGA
jgi:hypothetical protein